MGDRQHFKLQFGNLSPFQVWPDSQLFEGETEGAVSVLCVHIGSDKHRVYGLMLRQIQGLGDFERVGLFEESYRFSFKTDFDNLGISERTITIV